MRVVVVGAGVGGLTTAWRLVQRLPQARITVREAAGRPGGVTASADLAGCRVEHGPDSIVSTKPGGLALLRDLGLDDRRIGTRPEARRSLIVRDGRLVEVPEGLYLLAPGRIGPFLRSPLISWPGKLRMAWDLLLPRRPADAPEESLAAFVRRRLGREALDRLAQPMVGGIYTADPEELSVAATMPQFIAMEREHGSLIRAMMRRQAEAAGAAAAAGPRYGLFLSLEGGLQTLVDRLVEDLAARGVELACGRPVRALARADAGWLVDGEPADAVAICGPAHGAARLLAPAAPALAAELAAIPYAGVATVNLVYPAAAVAGLPAAAGFVVPACEVRTLVACTFATQKYAGRCPEGRAVLRAFVGGALHPQHLDRDDAALVAGCCDDLRRLAGIAAPPIAASVHRWPRSMAQPVIGHLGRVARIRAAERALPGLAIVGNGCEGVGIPDLAAQAEQAAARLAGFSPSPP